MVFCRITQELVNYRRVAFNANYVNLRMALVHVFNIIHKTAACGQ